ncbi:protein C3orf33 homolog isoform X1 [Oncorhynchus clarkii lewisi]|uniref:protein C3orf33 homolog isoform X1 n=1 Tax=Oncorhynchus clarkii lewisi TaxID=490388 RepID=UPI0039B88213
MPESRSEAETDEKGEAPSKNIISVISQFADDNLTIVRNISTGLAIAGVIVISRSIKLITRFGLASEIPARFIEKNVSLRGRVQTITETGLEVEHIPIYIPVLSPLLAKGMEDPLLAKGGGRVYPLAVRLAGVELTPEGRVWLEQHLSPAQTVWLKLVSREEETLHCLVSVGRGSLRSLCLNEEVLRLGLARTVPVSGLHPQSHLYLRLHQRLLKAEVKAERKGRGMWKEDSLWERTSQAVWDNSLVRLIRRIFKWT